MVAGSSQQSRIRDARQQVETSALLGVDFVPIRRGTDASAVISNANAQPAQVANTSRLAPGDATREAKQRLLHELRDAYEREMPPAPGAAHTRLVFGDGNPDADLMFIGEAPGADEDRLGVPFVGRAGKKLDDMIKAMGLAREEVYIANVLKRRPPGNATPTPEEAQRHGPWLLRQIEIIQPRVIVTLGKPASNYLLGKNEAMSRLRGYWDEYAGVPVMPTFHPAYLLRQYTAENRAKVWSDLQQAMARLNKNP